MKAPTTRKSGVQGATSPLRARRRAAPAFDPLIDRAAALASEGRKVTIWTHRRDRARRAFASGLSVADVAAAFGISEESVRYAVRGVPTPAERHARKLGDVEVLIWFLACLCCGSVSNFLGRVEVLPHSHPKASASDRALASRIGTSIERVRLARERVSRVATDMRECREAQARFDLQMGRVPTMADSLGEALRNIGIDTNEEA